GGFGRRVIRQTVADEDDVFAASPRLLQMTRLVVSPIRPVAESALPSGLFIRLNVVRQNFEIGEFVARNEQVDDLMEAGAQDGQRNLLLPGPAGEWRESGVDPNLFAQQSFGLGERPADAAHLGGDALAQTQLALADQPADGLDHPRPAAQPRRQKDQRVRFSDCAVEVGEDVRFCHWPRQLSRTSTPGGALNTNSADGAETFSFKFEKMKSERSRSGSMIESR